MRILFLNDVGFQYGAGIAQARQVQSLLLGGHVVGAVGGSDGALGDEILFTRPGLCGGWRGMRTLGHVFRTGRSDATLIDAITTAVAQFYPDLVVAGNLHGGWPLAVLQELTQLDCRVVAYLHDLNLVTGRCVHPRQCEAYLTGCDEACPTAAEYPVVPAAHIHDAWLLRRRLFNRPDAIELATNSEFMRRTVIRAMPQARVRVLSLGADEELFRPGDRKAARQALGLPIDRPIVLTGSVTMTDPEKGAQHLPRIMTRLGRDTLVVAFGHTASALADVHTLGYRTSPQDLALAYQAADVFLSTSAMESFGQTILEAALCGVPAVAFAVGGIPEIIQPGETGLLAPAGDVGGLADAVAGLIADTSARARLGAAARASCASRFSLAEQLRQWTAFLGEPRALEAA